ncbi:MAG: hypothetical protein J6039_01800 [Alphaproteobacteria bacterium]|nr:hypothetical protein [Alphaproteobacteria bacterium]
MRNKLILSLILWSSVAVFSKTEIIFEANKNIPNLELPVMETSFLLQLPEETISEEVEEN